MKIELEQRGKYLLIKANGRLDATWAGYFSDTLLDQIRKGQHDLVIDAAEIVFLSSAGIRALMIVFKELSRVQGRFTVSQPADFVELTLRTAGFESWLSRNYPEDMPTADGALGKEENTGLQHYCLNEDASLTLSRGTGWQPWQVVEEKMVSSRSFYQQDFALGIGSAAGTFEEALDQFGEFMAVAGNVVYQPAQEQSPPDYLIAEKEFIPQMQCLQALHFSGEMKQLLRFSPTEKSPFFRLSNLYETLLQQSGEKTIGFVILGEIDGLVGTALIRSPGRIETERDIAFPEVRDWLSFCGERCYSRQQALIVGVVGRTGSPCLPLLPNRSDLAAHIHGAVFPYQPLPNGEIDLDIAVGKFFNGPPPLAVMHLTEDNRPVVGLGESALIRGACWFGPLQNPEVLS